VFFKGGSFLAAPFYLSAGENFSIAKPPESKCSDDLLFDP